MLVSRRAGTHPSVTCDDYRGGRMVAEHLLSLGYRRVGVIAGEPFASTGIDRTAGFLDAYREEGVDVPAELVINSRFDTVGGHDAAARLLAVRPPPTALFAVNDFAAIGAMGAVREQGLQVGSDVSVVGFNDVSLARELPVPLATVSSPMHEMGQRAVECSSASCAASRSRLSGWSRPCRCVTRRRQSRPDCGWSSGQPMLTLRPARAQTSVVLAGSRNRNVRRAEGLSVFCAPPPRGAPGISASNL